ncbi:hypothetical protein CFP56_000267 [Quercus suber]|uniref:Phlebovirus glycoprotein G2 fusion domain-containing protein n=1 Tax=Quercus suber TaxID=58331 RepID=A0AAW0MCD2_QUESU
MEHLRRSSCHWGRGVKYHMKLYTSITITPQQTHKKTAETNIYYSHINEAYESIPSERSTIQLPLQGLNITAEFDLEVHIPDVCSSCYIRGGLCELDNRGKFHCTITEKGIDIGITQIFGATYIY